MSESKKKSKHGIKTPKEDKDIIRHRLDQAEVKAKELRNDQARNGRH